MPRPAPDQVSRPAKPRKKLVKVADPKGQAELARGPREKRTRRYKRAVEAAVEHAPPKQQAQAVKGARAKPSPEGKVVLKRAAKKGRETRDVKGKPDLDRGREYLYAQARKTVEGDHASVPGSEKRALKRIGLVRPIKNVGALGIPGFRQEYDYGDRMPVEKRGDYGKQSFKHDQQQAEKLAPALKVLEQTTRPVHGVMATTDDLLKGKSVGHALGSGKRGLQLKDKRLGSDVLKTVGAPKWLRGPGGFALDVVADPTTYVTLGTGSVAKKGAEKELQRTVTKAEKAGMSEPGQRTVARQAQKRALKKAPQGRGVTVRFAGKEVPGVRQATAATARATKKVVRKTAPKKVRAAADTAREVTREVRPTIAPKGADREAYAAARQAARRSRAAGQRESKTAVAQAVTLSKRLKPDEHALVIDALERRKIGSLPEHLREPARIIRDEQRGALRKMRRAGVTVGEVGATRAPTKTDGPARGYFPHALDEKIKEGAGVVERADGAGTGARKVRPDASFSRKDKRPLSEIHKTEPGKFSTDVPLVFANYKGAAGRAAAKGQLAQDLAASGRAVKPGRPAELGEGEALYRLEPSESGSRLVELKGKDQARALARPHRQLVALDKRTVDETTRSQLPSGGVKGLGRVIDRTTGAFKRVATFTPGFHVRNMIGDVEMAYRVQPGTKVARNTVQAGRALKRLTKVEASERKLQRAPKSGAKVKVAGKPMPLDDFVNLARKEGVVRSGFAGRDLEEVTRARNQGPVGKVKPERAGRWSQNREDLMRLSTFKFGLDRGMAPQAAADLAAKYHIDYGDLSSVERNVMRRFAPFYTFSARNIPLVAETLIQRPGKLANVEKARQELGRAMGFTEGWEQEVRDNEQRTVPLPVSWGGHKFTVNPGLPLSDLNYLPLSGNPVKDAHEAVRKTGSIMSPIFKDPFELAYNFSIFFEDQIERDDSPLVPAPAWAAKLPAASRRAAGFVSKTDPHPFIDKKSGKPVDAWRAKADYLARAVPGLPALFSAVVKSGQDTSGRSQTQRIIGVSGVKVTPVIPEGAKLERAFDERAKLEKRMNALNQRRINAERPTREYEQLSTRKKALDAEIYRLKVKRGDADPGRKPSSGRRLSLPAQIRKEAGVPTADQLRKELGLPSAEEIRREAGL